MSSSKNIPARLSENALVVLRKRYLRKYINGRQTETPDELFRRVAKAIARAELRFNKRAQLRHWEDVFYELIASLDFLPNSPTLMNAGTRLGQLSACFVLPVEDNMKSIFDTLKLAALIQQSGGGTGFNFSRLRPKGDFVRKTGGTASGPVSFMKIYDTATEHVKQGGKRRGANMGILNIDHPDVLQFINTKKENDTLVNFNISVGVTDNFMRAVENDTDWELKHPASGKTVAIVKARELWAAITQSAWESGDPGLLFLDAINRGNPTPGIGRIEATNPCGEVPLLPYEACNLGSINLVNMLRKKSKEYTIDWKKLATTTTTAIRFLDNVIEVNHYTTSIIRKMVRGNRKIGLGVMGWAEMLIRLGIPYDSEKAVSLGEQLMRFIQDESLKASKALAAERGTFPNWEKSIYYPHTPLRNATQTSIAPTGTISMLADVSSSIEPLFSLVYERKNILDGEVLPEVNKLFLEHLNRGKEDISGLLKRIADEGIEGLLKQLPDKTKRLFPTALDISYEWHIRHQIAFQKYTDNAVSKTINLPNATTVEEVSKAYRMAWKLKAKGITIYREGSKSAQVLNRVDKKQKQHSLPQAYVHHACKICID